MYKFCQGIILCIAAEMQRYLTKYYDTTLCPSPPLCPNKFRLSHQTQRLSTCNPQLIPLLSYLSSPLVFVKSAAMRWRSSSQTASGGSLCPERRYSGWTPHVSAKWRTWLTSPASTKHLCSTTYERDTTPAWSMWVHQTVNINTCSFFHQDPGIQSVMLCTCLC